MEEEDTFWMMTSVIEDLLPASYFSPSLIGVQADQLVSEASLRASCRSWMSS
ncbi:Small G protein signaling modulator 3 -like protein [Caligus rogercresseyi]|uniref:Small G protein signaling modulator 3 -like protein n=1 Tax=Caligus rogercresseyi TaxID=217165 RepID=A0A7T8GYS0_CALRO|nr:Small G protein signaling modulator 3 -like protein [Caligus rogercresseyi]